MRQKREAAKKSQAKPDERRRSKDEKERRRSKDAKEDDSGRSVHACTTRIVQTGLLVEVKITEQRTSRPVAGAERYL